jgi:hypothetical protein
MTWRVTVEKDDEGNPVVPLPDEALEYLGVGIGDTLYLWEEHVGTEPCLILSKTPQAPEQLEPENLPAHSS